MAKCDSDDKFGCTNTLKKYANVNTIVIAVV